MDKVVLVLGGRGLVGSSITRELKRQGYKNILCPSRDELDLLNQQQTLNYFEKNKPSEIYLAAAKVGGIKANNNFRADFIFENLQIQSNVFGASFKINVDKLLFLGASCIYPRDSAQPIKEEYLLTGQLEPTNEPYAIAKIAGVKMAENFRRQYGKKYYAVLPTNLYGQNDNYHPENSHVIPGLIQRFHNAKLKGDQSVQVWGTGNPKREFLFVDDLAKACVTVMNHQGPLPYWINIGTGVDITIRQLSETIAQVVGYKGEITFESNALDGMMRKVLDVSVVKSLGWKPEVDLLEGLKISYKDFLSKDQVS